MLESFEASKKEWRCVSQGFWALSGGSGGFIIFIIRGSKGSKAVLPEEGSKDPHRENLDEGGGLW